MIYALVNSKQRKDAEKIGSLTVVVDEYIRGDIVTKKILTKLEPQDTLVIENIAALGKNTNEIFNGRVKCLFM